MTSFSNFLKFVKGAIHTIKQEGITSIPIGYSYWKSTSPFLAELGAKTEYNKASTEKRDSDYDLAQLNEKIDALLHKKFEPKLPDFKLENNPLVSIIIPTYDNVEMLSKCLQSIEEKTTYNNYEIIIVTNNNDKNSKMQNFLSTLNHKIKFFEKEYSFSAINNFGTSFATGNFLLFLNDDTQIITEQWIESMLYLVQNNNVGAVGGQILYPNKVLQEAGGIIWQNGNAWSYGKNDSHRNENYNFVREVDYCSACMLLIKKSVFDKVGGFDPIYSPSYWEDIDLCLKLKKHGHTILYQPFCKIIHEENKTNPKRFKNFKSILLQNKEKFLLKWKDFLSNYPQEGSFNLQLAIGKSLGPKTLFILDRIPNLDEKITH